MRDSLRQRASRARSVLRSTRQRDDLRRRYLDLLERAITHTLYHRTDADVAPEFARHAFERALLETEATFSLEPQPERDRELGRDWPLYAPTMVGTERLRNVRRCVETVLAERVPGDLIEAGCWRGGVGILMRGVLAAMADADRTVWLADSFRGVPAPNDEEYPADAGDLNYTDERLAVSVDEVRHNFERFGLLDQRVRFLEGLFKDTLPAVRDRRWSVVRLDGDLYESTWQGLENLYPGLAPGGFMIVDDFGFPNCRAAVEDYRRTHGITEEVQRVDWTGAFWRRA